MHQFLAFISLHISFSSIKICGNSMQNNFWPLHISEVSHWVPATLLRVKMEVTSYLTEVIKFKGLKRLVSPTPNWTRTVLRICKWFAPDHNTRFNRFWRTIRSFWGSQRRKIIFLAKKGPPSFFDWQFRTDSMNRPQFHSNMCCVGCVCAFSLGVEFTTCFISYKSKYERQRAARIWLTLQY